MRARACMYGRMDVLKKRKDNHDKELLPSVCVLSCDVGEEEEGVAAV